MSEENIQEYMYRTRQFVIRPSDPLYPYLDDLCFKAKNLYNAALFRVRQVMTGVQKGETKRQPNEQEVLTEIHQALPAMNLVRWKTYMKSVRKLLDQAKSGQKVKPDHVDLKTFGQQPTTKVVGLKQPAVIRKPELQFAEQTQDCLRAVRSVIREYGDRNFSLLSRLRTVFGQSGPLSGSTVPGAPSAGELSSGKTQRPLRGLLNRARWEHVRATGRTQTQ